jgi:PIN domain nuclease of toxin-antitoxin system
MGIVKYLLDTHTLLWAIRESTNLSYTAKSAIADTTAQKFVSAVSAYEIMYKHRLGKLPDYDYIADNFIQVLHDFGADELPIDIRHAHHAGKFIWTHRDPFDRMLAAQAATDNLVLITNDPAFKELTWLTTMW